jgi:hypothetical protein
MKRSKKGLIALTLMHIGVCIVFGPGIMVLWMIIYYYIEINRGCNND